MIVKETKNADEIKSVLLHKDIFPCISSDDGCKSDTFEPPLTDQYKYIAGYVDGEIIALMVYDIRNDIEMCHIQVLPKHRKNYAIEFAEQALTFKSTLPLHAQIPSYYKNVLNFAKLNDFVVTGEDEEVYLKDGVEYPIFNLRYEGL